MSSSNIIQEYEEGVRDFQLAKLEGVDLRDANLEGVDLRYADLWNANLRNVNLQNVKLRGANLCFANLRGVKLWGADLQNANLSGANLQGADLRNSILRGANLVGANLECVDLRFVVGNGKEIKTFIFDECLVNVDLKNGIMSIGCEQHAIEEWRNFSDLRIQEMHPSAVLFWTKYKDFIFSFIDMEKSFRKTDIS